MSSSPQLLPPPAMPSPPALPRRASARNTRLHLRPEEPPIPPRLIGSPLLDKLLSPTASPASKQLAAQRVQEMWIDGDEFSVRKNGGVRAPGAPAPHPQQGTRYATMPPQSPAYAAAGMMNGSPTAQNRYVAPLR